MDTAGALLAGLEVQMEPGILRKQSECHGNMLAKGFMGCPMVRGKATWCRGLCQPQHGKGTCGRPAPHAMRGKTQRAIARYKRLQAARVSETPSP